MRGRKGEEIQIRGGRLTQAMETRAALVDGTWRCEIKMGRKTKVQTALGRKEQRGTGSGPEMPGDMMRARETWKMRGEVDKGGGRRGVVGGAAGRDDKTRKE